MSEEMQAILDKWHNIYQGREEEVLRKQDGESMRSQKEANRQMHAYYLHQLQIQQHQLMMATTIPSASSAGFMPPSQVSTSMAAQESSFIPSFYPTYPSQFPINPSPIQPTMTNFSYPIYTSSTFGSYPQHELHNPYSLNHPLPQENHVTPITSYPQIIQHTEIPYSIAKPTSAIQEPILDQETQKPMVDSKNNHSTTPTDTLTPVFQCELIKPQKTILENPISFLTSLAYLTLKVGDWNMLPGVLEMFDESMYPVIRTKYKLFTETYLPGAFFPIFEELFDPKNFSKEVVSVTSLSDVLLDDNAKLGGLNSLLVMEQSKPIHQNYITDSHNFARIRPAFSTDMVVSVLPPLLQRETYLKFGIACVKIDKNADFVDMLKQGEYNDPVIIATDELLQAQSMLLMHKRLLPGKSVGTALAMDV